MSEMETTRRLCLWSGPRNISTTLMYSFAQRSDTVVYDEPLYAHYLSKIPHPERHPGHEDVLNSRSSKSDEVINMMMGTHDRPVVFFKNMAHHALGLNMDFAKDCYNILLTRNPVDMLPSFHKVIPNPSINDVGYKAHVELLKQLNDMNAKVCVLDSTKILKNPQGVLKQLCSFCDIPFEVDMLSWEKGGRPEDGCWAPYWYKNVHNSTGFMPYKPKSAPFPEELNDLLEACMIHYQVLEKQALS